MKKKNYISQPLIQKHYNLIVSKEFILKKNYTNILEIPKITKITINTSSKVIVNDRKYVIPALVALEMITGQKMKSTFAKKSISAFKCRENQLIGCSVSLKGILMYAFLEKMTKLILPRSRHYSGVFLKNFDRKGNYTFGIQNLLLFPELESHFEFFEYMKGIDVTIVTSAKNKKEAAVLLSCLQFPIG